MKIAILSIHILVALLLVTLILLQSSKGGLGNAFGGGEFFRSKRGAERIVFTATIVCSVIFFVTSIVSLFVH
jgi:protein translocase SecG subunit